jgi:hypothetical protein
MDKPEISIIMPGIRRHKWDGVYNSIKDSTNKSFELIICGPYPLTDYLQEQKNVKYVKDWGSPVRASNIAAMLCEGKLVTWTADDATFFKDSLDKNIDILYSMGNDEKNVVLCKYNEGDNPSDVHIHMNPEYYRLNNSVFSSPYLKNEWFIFNVGIMYRSFFEFLGAWDSVYEGTAMSHNDFAVRAYFYGAKTALTDVPLFKCEHMPGSSGDHAPIHQCQHSHDEPTYISTYNNERWVLKDNRLNMLNNWKQSEMVWNRRFK